MKDTTTHHTTLSTHTAQAVTTTLSNPCGHCLLRSKSALLLKPAHAPLLRLPTPSPLPHAQTTRPSTMPGHHHRGAGGGGRGCRYEFPSSFASPCGRALHRIHPSLIHPHSHSSPRHKAASALHNTSLSKKKKTTRKGKKRDGGMDGFLLPGAKSHYAPDLMILPVHQGRKKRCGVREEAA